jgi:hypothetical protein
VAGIGLVLVAAVTWLPVVVGSWLLAYPDLISYPDRVAKYPGSQQVLPPSLALAGGTVCLGAGGLIGGAALGLLASTIRRALPALTIAVGVEVVLAWALISTRATGTSPLVMAVFSGLLLLATSVSGAAASLATHRHPAGVAILIFLTAALVLSALLVAAVYIGLSSLNDDFDHRESSRHAVKLVLASLQILVPLMIAAAAAVAVHALPPLRASVTVATGLMTFLAAQTLLLGAWSLPTLGWGTKTATAVMMVWFPEWFHGFDLPNLRYFVGLAVPVGILTGLATRSHRRPSASGRVTTREQR